MADDCRLSLRMHIALNPTWIWWL